LEGSKDTSLVNPKSETNSGIKEFRDLGIEKEGFLGCSPDPLIPQSSIPSSTSYNK
jgi:hypothetical protein